MRRELVDIPGRDADPGRLGDLAAYLDAETEQRGTTGIVVTVGVTNGGGHDLPLLNPFEVVQFQVRDERGMPRQVPTKPPSLLVHRADGEAWTLDNPLPVRDVRRNGESIDPGALDTEVFTVGAGEEWRVSFAIDRFVAEDGATDAQVPDGAYGVRCLATLIDAERRQTSRIVQSEELEIRFARGG